MAERDDILVDAAPAPEEKRPLRAKFAAFVPITIAILGIGAILLGGVSARQTVATVAPAAAVDPIATGSIAGD